MAVPMIGKASSGGAVGKTPAKAGMKTGAKQTGVNKMFKNQASAARRKAIKVVHGKSGLPNAPTSKGRGVFQATTQQTAFTNPTGVMKGAGSCKFVN